MLASTHRAVKVTVAFRTHRVYQKYTRRVFLVHTVCTKRVLDVCETIVHLEKPGSEGNCEKRLIGVDI